MKLHNLVLAICIGFLSIDAHAQVERKVLLQLEQGESLVMNESSVFGNVGDNYCLITVKYINSKPNYFKWNKDGKKGPFTKENLVICDNPSEICYDQTEFIISDGEAPNVMYEAEGSFVEFNGKKYGPYETITALKMNSEKTKAFMTVTKTGKTYFECSDGRSVELQGMPDNIFVSPSGNDAYAKTVGAYSMADLINLAGNPEGIDMSKMNQVNFTGIDGKKVGPFEGESITSWFCKYSDTWLLRVDDDLYASGVKWKTLGFVYPNSFWFLDKTRYAYLSSDGQLFFSDGKTFSYPICIQSEKAGTTVFLKWISIESNEVVFYKKAL
jgi:hypothetical protein